jgi:hypothetical protein
VQISLFYKIKNIIYKDIKHHRPQNGSLEENSVLIKIGSVCSSFLDIYKGVPQGSILGPVMFNIFINDIFDFVKKGDLHNYADDNTKYVIHEN